MAGLPSPAYPKPQGLYDGQSEHDACGVAMVATLRGAAGHDIVQAAITALRNLDHRGASGAEPDSGDGAGILTQVPDAFLRAVAPFELPAKGAYAVGTAFLPQGEDAEKVIAGVERIAAEEGLVVLGWRDVPTSPDLLGRTARSVMPEFRQVFVASQATGDEAVSGIALDRLAFCLRKRVERELDTYFPSLSARTL